MEKPIVLVIMDGVGKGDGGSGDAVKVANTPTLDNLLATCPHTYAMVFSRFSAVQSGSIGNLDSIAAAAVTLADAVHNNKNNGFFHDFIPPKTNVIAYFCILLVVLFYIISGQLTTPFLFFPFQTKKLPGNYKNK